MADRPLIARADELRSARVPYVHARVVLAEAPTSAKPGAEALILPDGTIEGFVGGDCAESTVRAQSLTLLDSGESLLLRITPEPEDGQSGKLVVHNPCLSGGTLEIFLEPVLPANVVVIVGESPIALALSGIAEGLGWHPESPVDVEQVTTTALSGAAAVVVASHGRGEEGVLRAALDADVPYVGLVASTKRGAAVIESLDRCTSHTSRIHSPAGLDIGARTPEEVALSIMAEIVSLRPQPSGRPVPENTEPSGSAIDPVCGMTVATVEASLHLDHDGDRRWFCGSGCLRAFASDPLAYTPT
ncbi:XdhC family protein [Ilumatobacter sp.]|uniref:XdhC family protein n=1 Tax=Ilumatobacter sp. TaxID=1967498 RepID=UPI003AF5EF2A